MNTTILRTLTAIADDLTDSEDRLEEVFEDLSDALDAAADDEKDDLRARLQTLNEAMGRLDECATLLEALIEA